MQEEKQIEDIKNVPPDRKPTLVKKISVPFGRSGRKLFEEFNSNKGSSLQTPTSS
jgi:hypothetical protein